MLIREFDLRVVFGIQSSDGRTASGMVCQASTMGLDRTLCQGRLHPPTTARLGMAYYPQCLSFGALSDSFDSSTSISLLICRGVCFSCGPCILFTANSAQSPLLSPVDFRAIRGLQT